MAIHLLGDDLSNTCHKGQLAALSASEIVSVLTRPAMENAKKRTHSLQLPPLRISCELYSHAVHALHWLVATKHTIPQNIFGKSKSPLFMIAGIRDSQHQDSCGANLMAAMSCHNKADALTTSPWCKQAAQPPYLGWTHSKLVALPPHVLHEDAQVQGASATHDEGLRRLARGHPKGQVALQLPIQPLLDLPAGHELALPPRKGAGVDRECHAHCWLFYLDIQTTMLEP